MATSDMNIPWEAGMSIGSGWKSLTHESCMASAVKFKEAKRKQRTLDVKYEHFMINNETSLSKMLDVNASLVVNAGGLSVSGEGSFLKNNSSIDANLNFVVRIVVRNYYADPIEEPEFILPDTIQTPEDFYEVLGDCYIADAEEGGSFTGILSVTAHKSEDLMKIEAELKVGFSYVQAQGKGKYSDSSLRNMATVSGAMYSAGGGSVDITPCTPQSLFEQAAKFHSSFKEEHSPARAILKKYTTLRNFINKKNWKKLVDFKSQSFAANEYQTLAKDAAELDWLSMYVNSLVHKIKDGKTSYRISESENAYPATEEGMNQAVDDIKGALATIQEKGKLLRKRPFAKSCEDLGDEKKTDKYMTAKEIRKMLPTENKQQKKKDTGAVGTSVGACILPGASSLTAGIVWQSPTWEITAGTLKDNSWATEPSKVGVGALSNTPIATIASADGKSMAVYYITAQGQLVERVKLTGAADWSEGDLGTTADLPKPFTASSLAAVRQTNGDIWLFFQDVNRVLAYMKYSMAKKTWVHDPNMVAKALDNNQAEQPIVINPGSNIAVAIVTPGSATDVSNEVLCLLFQDVDLKIRDLRCTTTDQPRWAFGQVPVAQPLPLQTPLAVCSTGDNHLRAVIGNKESRLIVYSYDKDSWTQVGTISSGFRGIGVATIGGGDTSRIFAQSQENMGINEYSLNAQDSTWKDQGSLDRVRESTEPRL